MSIKQPIKNHISTTRTVTKNFCEFLDAACLAGVSGFAIYQALDQKGFWYKALLFAGLVIALQAFLLLVRHFNHPVTK